jgi:hypothetical protein
MGNYHCPYDNAPVTPARQLRTAVIGGPTAVIDIAGTRLVTAPGPGPPGGYRFMGETTGPPSQPPCSETPTSSCSAQPSPKFHRTRDFLRRARQNGCSSNSPDRK